MKSDSMLKNFIDKHVTTVYESVYGKKKKEEFTPCLRSAWRKSIAVKPGFGVRMRKDNPMQKSLKDKVQELLKYVAREFRSVDW